MHASTTTRTILSVLLLSASLAACSLKAPESTATPTDTPATPTQTPIPTAAVVNGEGILAAEFEAEVGRYLAAQTALGQTPEEGPARELVLEDLINQVLLAQGAAEAGFVLDDAALQERIDVLITQVGGEQALFDWQTAHGFSDAEFRTSLRRQAAAAWMRDTIADAVPLVAEQVHVKQILLYNSDTADDVWAQLQAGADFETLAAYYDPMTQGELDWFPRGYLLHPQIEAAAFALQPGQYSEVIESEAGYHIIMVLGRETDHTLPPDARLSLQMIALQDWLAEKRLESTITITP